MHHKIGDWRYQLTKVLQDFLLDPEKLLSRMELSNSDRLSGMAEGAKIWILRSGTYVWKCLGSTQWSNGHTSSNLSVVPTLLPQGTVNAAHTSVQQQQYMFRSLVMHFASWVVAILLTDQHPSLQYSKRKRQTGLPYLSMKTSATSHYIHFQLTFVSEIQKLCK